MATLNEGIERLDAYVSRYVPQMALSVLVPLLIAAYILPLDWTSAVLLLVTGPVIPLLMILVGSYAEAQIQRQWIALSRMSAHFLDIVQGLPTLKLFGRSEAQSARIAQVSDTFRERTMQVLRIAFLSGAVLEFMTAIAIGLIAVTLGVRLLNGGISFEQAFLVLLLAPEFYRPLRELGVHRHAGMEGKAAAKRIVEILETPVPLQTNQEGVPLVTIPPGGLTIEFTDLMYTYPGSDRPALKEVNLTLPARTCTALVGRSGAGKSTLVNLLLRFMDVQGGGITANGIPLTDLPAEAWRASVALVPQRPYLFSGSVRANIRLLSAGQVQRLAIARAFLEDAPLLVLDEPTSSLDPESETLIRQALERLVQDRTVLVIAHRLNTIAHAQQIAVLEDGRLVEIGCYEELMRRSGPYSRLVDAYRMGEVPV